MNWSLKDKMNGIPLTQIAHCKTSDTIRVHTRKWRSSNQIKKMSRNKNKCRKDILTYMHKKRGISHWKNDVSSSFPVVYFPAEKSLMNLNGLYEWMKCFHRRHIHEVCVFFNKIDIYLVSILYNSKNYLITELLLW